jgi:putative ABC transport system ATP-binding protein
VTLHARGLGVVRDGRSILEDVDLTVEAGETVVLSGPSGSGKTTLLHVIGGLVKPDTGTVVIGARAPGPADPRVAMVLQNFGLVALLTAWENAALPLRSRGLPAPEVKERVGGAFAALGLEEFASRLTRDLSGGQRQRVALARALARRADLLLADEPSSALDEHWRVVAVEALLAEGRRGATVVIASHDSQVVSAFGRVVHLLEGRAVVGA